MIPLTLHLTSNFAPSEAVEDPKRFMPHDGSQVAPWHSDTVIYTAADFSRSISSTKTTGPSFQVQRSCSTLIFYATRSLDQIMASDKTALFPCLHFTQYQNTSSVLPFNLFSSFIPLMTTLMRSTKAFPY